MAVQAKARKPLARIGKKLPKCEWCKTEFLRQREFQKVCSVPCSIEKTRAEQIKKACAPYRVKPARKTKEQREARARHKPTQLELTQKASNALVRERDHGLPCISCGITYGKMNAGHFKSVGAHPELRFEPLNAHIQCEQCNSSKSGNIGPYRVNLIKKIGIEAVEWLEGPHEAKHYTCEQLIDMRAAMRAEARALAKIRGSR